MNREVTGSWEPRAETIFDDDRIHSGFEQPRGKGMTTIVEVACDDLREILTPVEICL
jgi:hypothetical protein